MGIKRNWETKKGKQTCQNICLCLKTHLVLKTNWNLICLLTAISFVWIKAVSWQTYRRKNLPLTIFCYTSLFLQVKLPGQWDQDKTILEMGGVTVSHSQRGDVWITFLHGENIAEITHSQKRGWYIANTT